ncbi:MAG: O-phosphoseryl-tRNA(Sec) selenium transferase [Methanopyri archaeon]|nr:O-phosphoseryl-tRNA(Sec) selenium transferase [Methanopyri archaeon]
MFPDPERLSGLIPPHMLERGRVVWESYSEPVKRLLEQRRMPDEGWPEDLIAALLWALSRWDTDKDPRAARIGEREARVVSRLAELSAFGFCHGIGRSGTLVDPQPKAPGASMMYALTNRLLEDFLSRLGYSVKAAFAVPGATGLAISLCLSGLAEGREVIYPYAAHKSPIKAIRLAGFDVRIVDTEIDGDEVVTDPAEVEDAVRKSPDPAAILATVTFFPPRREDPLPEIAEICEEYDVPLVVNNAYGVQHEHYRDVINRAVKKGRVDAIVSSTDKNLLTPVGGSFVYSPDETALEEVSRAYPGRASAVPVVHALISLLRLGMNGYRELMRRQKECRRLLDELLEDLESRRDDVRVLDVYNPIAAAVAVEGHDPVDLAARLYVKRVTGPRGVRADDPFGTSRLRGYHSDYVTINAAIGARREDVEEAVRRFEEVLEGG